MNVRHQPHDVAPQQSSVRVVQAVKNFAAIPGVCHIGLGVTATNNCKVLRANGIWCESWAIHVPKSKGMTTEQQNELEAKQLEGRLHKAQAHACASGHHPVSHVIVSAPSWIQPKAFQHLAVTFPDVQFVLENHSGCAYLSIDKYGIRNIRECVDLSLSLHNFTVAANNTRVVNWLSRAFNFECVYLQNLYDCSAFVNPYPCKPTICDTLRIGSFGASRPWKNQLTAAEAAVQLARQLGVKLELYVNSKRPDGGERMIESRAELFDQLRGCALVEVPWESWPRFRTTCGHMHLLLQPSFDETFNVVTADGIAAGVPSVTSSAIEWTPPSWWAETCDPTDLVRVGLYLLNDTYAVEDARRALTDYVSSGVERWKKYLFGTKN